MDKNHPYAISVKLVTGHAFSILGAYTINVDGNTINLIKIRNPHNEEK